MDPDRDTTRDPQLESDSDAKFDPDLDHDSDSDFDPDGENKLVAAACYQYSHLPESQIRMKVEAMSVADKTDILNAYIGNRDNRRHRPGRAFESIDYRFDVLSDYGAFRDMQRHRLLTIEWQPLTPYHGYSRPELVDAAGGAEMFDEVMARSASLYDALAADHPYQASYAVSMAYRIRYVMQFNAREAMHMLELRSGPQGHPSYRRVALEMHKQISEKAGHHAVAAATRRVVLQSWDVYSDQGVAQGWYIAGPLALKSMLRVKRHVGDLFIPQNSSERIVFRCRVNSIGRNARATHGGFLHGDLLRVLTARTRIDE
jgi:hypothetical protein